MLVISSYQLKELKTILKNQVDEKYVKAVHSKAYDSLISKNIKDHFSIENNGTALSKSSDQYVNNVRKLKQRNDSTYILKGFKRKTLYFNGSFTTSVEVKNRNAIPEVQHQYVQGRSENGNPVWKGPETNELFSFGPDISALGFDGQPYTYDQNGRLVQWMNGLSRAKGYDNDLFKTIVGYSNRLNANLFIKEEYVEKFRLSLDLGQQKDQMYFMDQFNNTHTFKTKFTANLGGYVMNMAFNYDENKATNVNRAGLFNRIYQNALLTPVSFSNAQQLLLNDGSQRSYSQYADNPSFLLLQNNQYHYLNNQRQVNFSAAKTWKGFKLNIAQSYENNSIWNLDRYKLSTSGFSNGIYNERTQKNSLYYSNIQGAYTLPGNYDFKNSVLFNFILNDKKSEVYNSLTDQKYSYQRTSQDYILNYNMEIYDGDFEAGINLGNSFYVSNTSHKNSYWLPQANAYVKFADVFNWNHFNFKILGSYTRLSSEPEITRSYAFYATTLLEAENNNQYFPIREVETFRGLSNINTIEWKAGARMNIGYHFSLEENISEGKFRMIFFPFLKIIS